MEETAERDVGWKEGMIWERVGDCEAVKRQSFVKKKKHKMKECVDLVGKDESENKMDER